jgi:hypothetical protein
VCVELINSIRLRKIFGIILKVGNKLNGAGNEEEIKPGFINNKSTTAANGFSVESLPKLNQIKGCDKKTTILYYIISLIQRANPSLLDLKEELPHLYKVPCINFSDHDKSLSMLKAQLSNAQSMLFASPSLMETTNNNEGMTNEQKLIHETTTTISNICQEHEECKLNIASVMEYFSAEENFSFVTLLNIIAMFCKEIEDIRNQLVKSRRKKIL